MYVVYENPMPMVSDSPTAYEGQVGFDFIADVPTTWDETRFVAGEAGEFIVVARRKGHDWYLAGMTNDTPRDIKVPLEFLDAGAYGLTLYADGASAEDDPNAIDRNETEAPRAAPLSIHLAPGGGFAAVLRPK
jgi:alpha-glucosidase